MCTAHPKGSYNYDESRHYFCSKRYSLIAPHWDEQQSCCDQKQGEPDIEDQLLVTVEKTKIRQPNEAREEHRVAIVLQQRAFEPSVIQADIVNPPEILVSHRPVPQTKVSDAGNQENCADTPYVSQIGLPFSGTVGVP